jgi:hypothetical protein
VIRTSPEIDGYLTNPYRPDGVQDKWWMRLHSRMHIDIPIGSIFHGRTHLLTFQVVCLLDLYVADYRSNNGHKEVFQVSDDPLYGNPMVKTFIECLCNDRTFPKENKTKDSEKIGS